jgi:hypothetical protein
VDHFDELGADSVEDQIVGMHAATDPMLLIAGNKRMRSGQGRAQALTARTVG